MKLYLVNAPRYAAEQIMMMLFPEDRPECVETCPNEGDYAQIEISERNQCIFAKTTIFKHGCVHFGEDSLPIDDCISDELEKKRRLHQALKVSFYKSAIQVLSKLPEWGAMTGIRPAKVAAKLINSGKNVEESDGVLRDVYFVSEPRRKLSIAAALQGIKVSKSFGARDVSLYVGIPFCASRCKYCSFVSHSIDKAAHLVEPYIDTLLQEMKIIGKAVADSKIKIDTVYIGGGTPTALSCEQLCRVMSELAHSFDLSNVREYTVEAGRPDTADYNKLLNVAKMGATRVSVNPQTMDDRILKLMGRNHTAEDIIRMVSDIREIGGLQINMDVIAGLPGDSVDGFCDTIRRVLALEPENVTVHTLALKKGSALRDEKMQLSKAQEVEKMVDFAREAVCDAGFAPYYLYRQKYMSGNLENVGYAKPGCENIYNVLIMEELQTILSLGAGGVTKLVDTEHNQIVRIFNPKYPYEYNGAVERFSDTAKQITEFYNK